MSVRQVIGNAADAVGTKFNLDEGSFSEWLAGTSTTNSDKNTPTIVGAQQQAAADKAATDAIVAQNNAIKQANADAAAAAANNTTKTTKTTSGVTSNTGTTNTDTNTGGTDSVYAALLEKLNGQNSVYQQMLDQQAAAKAAQEQAAKSAYDEVLRQSDQYKTNTQNAYDTNTKNITSRYDTLAQRIADSISNLEANKASSENSLENNYQSAQAQEYAGNRSAERQNRNLARAMNRGDSSFYEDIMTENDVNTASALDALMSEKSTKDDELYNNYTTAKTSLDNQAADSETERANMMQQALDEYNTGIQTAQQLASQGLIDYNSAVSGLQSNLANNYLQIASQQQSNNLNSASILAAVQGALSNLGAISTSSGVDSTLSNAVSNLLGNMNYLNEVDNTGTDGLNNLLSLTGKSGTKKIGEI